VTLAKTFPVRNLATGETIIEVADLGVADTAKDIHLAYEAQVQWRAKTVKEPCSILLRWKGLMPLTSLSAACFDVPCYCFICAP